MTEDDILAKVGRHVRDEQQDDAAFEKIARGEPVPAELAERAKEDAALARRLEASRPLGSDVLDRIARRHATRFVIPDGGKPKVVPLFRRIGVYAAPLALAAGVFLFFAVRGPEGTTLPGYAVTATGEQELRGEARQTLAIGKSPSSRFEIVARPDVATNGKVVAYAFAMHGTEPSPLDAKVDVAETGSVRFTGTARALEGTNELRIVIGSTDSIAKFDDAVARARDGKSDERVRVLSIPVERR